MVGLVDNPDENTSIELIYKPSELLREVFPKIMRAY
jgi:hypothetical protein